MPQSADNYLIQSLEPSGRLPHLGSEGLVAYLGMSNDLGGVPAQERITRYRAFERAALVRARDTKVTELRESYLELARGWASLVDQIEKTSRPDQPSEKTRSTPALPIRDDQRAKFSQRD